MLKGTLPERSKTLLDCVNCGHQNRAGDVYCRRCGQGLHSQEQRRVSAASPSGRPIRIGKKPLGIGCLLGPIVGGGISSLVGVIVGHISSLFYTLLGDTQNSALAYLLSGLIFVLSFGLSLGLSTVARKIGLKPK